MEDQLVSLEVAELLKEKGFEEICYNYFPAINRVDRMGNNCWNEPLYTRINNALPTQSLAQKWLMQRGFIVLVDIDFTELSSFYCNVYNPSGLIALQTVYCDSYQKALEEGLKMTLKII